MVGGCTVGGEKIQVPTPIARVNPVNATAVPVERSARKYAWESVAP